MFQNRYGDDDVIGELSRRQLFQWTLGVIGTVSLVGAPAASVQEDDLLFWGFQTGADVQSSPTVVDGTVFVGSNNANMYAIDAASGEKEWSFQTEDQIASSPTVVDDTVFVGSLDSTVYALDAASGTEQWSFEADAPVMASPTVMNDTVFIAGGTGVYALDAASSAEQWSFHIDGVGASSLTVVDDTVFVGSWDDGVYAVNANTGEEEWSFQTGDRIRSSPTLVDGTVFIGSGTVVEAVDADTGTGQWTFEADGSVQSSPTVRDGTVFVGCGDGSVYALDAGTGEEEWAFEAGAPVQSSPTVVDDTIFIGSDDGTVYALNSASGEQESGSFQTDAPVVSSPTVVDGTVFVGSNDGNVYAVDAGVDGSSNGSRVSLRSLGHHDDGTLEMPTPGVVSEEVLTVDVNTGGAPYGPDRYTVPEGDGYYEEAWNLEGFSIYESPGRVRFDFEMSEPVQNPWNLDQMSMPFLQVYVRSESVDSPTTTEGRTGTHIETEYAYHYRVLVHGEGTSVVEDTAAEVVSDDVEYIVDGDQISISVPRSALDWDLEEGIAIAPLVMSFDGFSEGDTREVSQESGEHLFGGGVEGVDDHPAVLDLAIPEEDTDRSTVLNYDENTTPVIPMFELGDTEDAGSTDPNDEPSSVEGTEEPTVDDEDGGSIQRGGQLLGAFGATAALIGAYLLSHSREYDEADSASHSPDELLEDASEVCSTAREAQEEAAFQSAAESYNKAIDAYQSALAGLTDDDDLVAEAETGLNRARDRRQEVRKLQSLREDLEETLASAERNFRTAAVAHARDEGAITQIRYRQARDSFESAVNQIEAADPEAVSAVFNSSIELQPETDDELPIRVADLPLIPDETIEWLTEQNLSTVNSLRVADKDMISSIRDADAIDEQTARRLLAVAWVPDGPIEFTDTEKITRRREQAAAGAQATQ